MRLKQSALGPAKHKVAFVPIVDELSCLWLPRRHLVVQQPSAQ